jgi:hypothetical protein
MTPCHISTLNSASEGADGRRACSLSNACVPHLQMLQPLLCVLDVCSHPDLDLFKMAVWTIGKVAYSIHNVHRTSEGDQRLKLVYKQFVTVLSNRCRCGALVGDTAYVSHSRRTAVCTTAV